MGVRYRWRSRSPGSGRLEARLPVRLHALEEAFELRFLHPAVQDVVDQDVRIETEHSVDIVDAERLQPRLPQHHLQPRQLQVVLDPVVEPDESIR